MSHIGEQSTVSATVHQWRHLSHRYQVGWDETILIALNIHGLHSHGHEGETVRLRVQPPQTEVFQLVVPAGRPTSPFTVTEGDLRVDGTPVARVVDLRSDNSVSGYLRGGGRAATIHPRKTDDPQFSDQDGYTRLLADLAISLPQGRTLPDLDEVTVSAANYPDEATAMRDLATLRTAMTSLDMTARIGVLSSVVTSAEAFTELSRSVAPFTLFLDTDAQPDDSPMQPAEVLAAARGAGHEASFTYTVGKEPLDDMRDRLLPLAQYTTVWPSLNILQAPSPEDDAPHIAEPAERLDYFLQARAMVERIFAPTDLIPQPWRCYRGLWYREHATRPLPGPWI